MKKQYLLVLLVVIIAALTMGIAYTKQQRAAQIIADDSSVHIMVTQFGAAMQKVSLSAPDALQQIAAAYSPYASTSLISYWQNNRAFAPGRGLSSPWPDRIDITSATRQADGSYVVEGNVIEVTSQEVSHGGIAAEFPITLSIVKYPSGWLMTNYTPGPVKVFANASTTIVK